MLKSMSWTGNLNQQSIDPQLNIPKIQNKYGASSATTSPINQPSLKPLQRSSNSDYRYKLIREKKGCMYF